MYQNSSRKVRKWGGAREGTGPKRKGRARRSINLTDREFDSVKRHVAALRTVALK
jgi:hypothetical protein